MNWLVGVITCPRAQPTLTQTLRSLDAAGWPTLLNPETLEGTRIWHDEDMIGCYRSWRLLAQHLLDDERTADRILICEDDILVTPNLRSYLESSPLPKGVVSLYTGAINHHDERGWHRVTKLPKQCHGALATIWTPELLRGFLEYDRSAEFANGTDTHIGRWCRNTDTPYMCHSPSFVRHTGYTSTLGPGWDEANTWLRNCKEWCECTTALS